MLPEIDIRSIRCGNCAWFRKIEGNISPIKPDFQLGFCANNLIDLDEIRADTNPFDALMKNNRSLVRIDPTIIPILRITAQLCYMTPQDFVEINKVDSRTQS